jgi:hypothetical protein
VVVVVVVDVWILALVLELVVLAVEPMVQVAQLSLLHLEQ